MAATILGVTTKTGWCAVVGVTGPADRPEVVVRRRIELCPDGLPAFAYHAAAELPPAEGKPLVEKIHAAARRAAAAGLRAVVAEAAAEAPAVTAIAIEAGGDPLPDDLEWIARSHMRLHAAEGEL